MKEKGFRLIDIKTGTMFKFTDTNEDDVYRQGDRYHENRITARNMRTKSMIVFSTNPKIIPI